jgi:hypothetical protein
MSTVPRAIIEARLVELQDLDAIGPQIATTIDAIKAALALADEWDELGGICGDWLMAAHELRDVLTAALT